MTERDFLRGPDDLRVDLERADRIHDEFVMGCRALHDIGDAVTVFGSARTTAITAGPGSSAGVWRRRGMPLSPAAAPASWRRPTAARRRAAA